MKTLLAYFITIVLSTSFLTLSSHAQSTWHLRDPLPTPVGLRGMAYGKGLFVAVGHYNTIITSPDAVIWTSRSQEDRFQLLDVAFGNDRFVAVGTVGDYASYKSNDEFNDEFNNGAVRTSVDGMSWSALIAPHRG